MQEIPRRIPIAAANEKESPSVHPDARDALPFIAGLAVRYELTAIQPLLRVCQSAAATTDLNIAVLGRFKAGKSSFLNHFLGRDLLPVGVVPVTSVITELQWGPCEQAEVQFLDDHIEPRQLDQIGEFIAESKNPENIKGVRAVYVRFPDLADYKDLRFIDTPGLESSLTHNTEASLAWVPNVDLALVAIGVDPPLSQQDINLIRKLFEYTPRVCLLLTKVDLLSDQERHEVIQFVRTELNRNFKDDIDVFPYSIRPGFEELRSNLKARFIDPVLRTIRDQKEEAVNRKVQTLLRECSDYLQLTLRSAEMMDDQRTPLRNRVFGEKEAFSDTSLELRLAARHNIGLARTHIEKTLEQFEKEMQLELRDALDLHYPAWRASFAQTLEHFESWLRGALLSRLTLLSSSEKLEFLKPAFDAQRQFMRVLQGFRDRISAQMLEILGVPLRTTETEIQPESPKAPDIDVGPVFDHNWELLSPIIPMMLFRNAVKTRFLDRISYETTKNLSRLTTQWADIIAATINSMQCQAERRLGDFINTVEHLTASSSADTAEIRTDLQKLRRLEACIES